MSQEEVWKIDSIGEIIKKVEYERRVTKIECIASFFPVVKQFVPLGSSAPQPCRPETRSRIVDVPLD